ncbi:hypothetical protein TSTA_051830 [Talaromyces stipitatus ATCC 10500]|uniref:Reverse transcriptase RNase H-like domain-containing protein n=1 Tax=Talaromyces stipitatus (strain ATCC 10500 / CBS 375.48 / QM 6759 / NRRL 1006) TaxID=441959 RepID=B8MJP7_TALSN|nr:uncharacterized protein TSTA_051830 [Talaromyces stipitatus ATCC 10500]EED15746.1 hypothetical protein TSTA_051830 [Talaromyces stipitatus ATCC 10500]
MALRYFMTTKRLTARQARWCKLVNQYYFIIKHHPGKENTLADTLTWRESTPVNHKKGCMQLMLPKKCLGPSLVKDSLSVVEKEEDVISRVITINTRSPECKQFQELMRTGDKN